VETHAEYASLHALKVSVLKPTDGPLETHEEYEVVHWRAHAGSDFVRSTSAMLYAQPDSERASDTRKSFDIVFPICVNKSTRLTRLAGQIWMQERREHNVVHYVLGAFKGSKD
jgi:hypothetical protein